MLSTLKKAVLAGVVGAGALLVTAIPASAAPVPLVNGSFETPNVAPLPFRPNVTNANTPAFTGWEITNGNIDIVRSYWQPSSGSQSLDLNGCAGGTIRQKVPTVNGAQYTLTFAKAGNPGIFGAIRSAEVSAIDSVTSGALATKVSSFDTTGKSLSNMGWVDDTLSFVGSGNDVWLQFRDTSAGFCAGLALDNVRLDEEIIDPVIPEASLVALLPLSAVALMGAGYVIVRRRPAAA